MSNEFDGQLIEETLIRILLGQSHCHYNALSDKSTKFVCFSEYCVCLTYFCV